MYYTRSEYTDWTSQPRAKCLQWKRSESRKRLVTRQGAKAALARKSAHSDSDSGALWLLACARLLSGSCCSGAPQALQSVRAHSPQLTGSCTMSAQMGQLTVLHALLHEPGLLSEVF
eukprot:Mrub_02444.p5 GENE.Mrub_02444~~Mrub_02444.p5  ORF type:complete len:117 (+),score=32.18 Mrub_02444:1295-1645(+)